MYTCLRIFLAVVGIVIFLIIGSVSVNAQIGTSPVSASLQGIASKVKDKEEFMVDIYLKTKPNDRISAATATLNYPPQALLFSEENSSEPSEQCRALGYGLTQTVRVLHDPKTAKITITRLQIGTDEELPSGTFCFGTVRFQARITGFWRFLPWISRKGAVSLASPDLWEIAGPANNYSLILDQSNASLPVVVTH